LYILAIGGRAVITLRHWLRRTRPPTLRPTLWLRIRDAFTLWDLACAADAQRFFPSRLREAYEQGERELSASRSLEDMGYDLLDKDNEEEVRVQGCVWLTLFPSREMVFTMRRIALDPQEPIALRNQATWTLGFRQLQHRHDALHWSPELVGIADEALLALLRESRKEGAPELSQLMSACRHVASEALLDALAEDVVRAAPAIEAFATPKLAHALLAKLREIPSEHALRAVRLVGYALGAEAAPGLLAYAAAEDAPLAAKVGALFTALAVDAERARPAVEAFIATQTFDRVHRARLAWHDAHPGAHPIVRMLAIARTTATIEPEDRAARCLEATRDLAELAAIEPFNETYLYAMWRHLAYRSRDPAAIRACVESHEDALDRAPHMIGPYLEALAASGRFDKLGQVAAKQGRTDEATWLLATHGRPFRALAMRKLAPRSTPRAVAGQALALFLCGRPDLAELALSVEKPCCDFGSEAFPGEEERWRMEHVPETAASIRACVDGMPALLGAIRGAEEPADPDLMDFALLGELERVLRRDLSGATVCIVGRFSEARAIEAALTAKGARVVSGPFPGTQYFVAAPDADLGAIGRLTNMGARQLDVTSILAAGA
jgi:hypothetical protein